MYLNAGNVLHYLWGRGLVSARKINDGDYMVIELVRRNRNFKVVNRCGEGLFVKQVGQWTKQSVATLRLEAHCYELVHQVSELSMFVNLLPRFKCYDNQQSILITELLNGESLASYYLRMGQFPPLVTSQLGTALGQCHLVGTICSQCNGHDQFPRTKPWILQLHKVPLHRAEGLSEGQRRLQRIVRQHSDFGRILDSLAAEWKFETLVHGDIKWDNCMVVDLEKGREARLVDWELADIGDPGWDVGGIFSAFLSLWIESIPFGPKVSVEAAVGAARFPIESMQLLIRLFWSAYCSAAQIKTAAVPNLLRQAVLFCGARLVQTAHEYVQDVEELTQLALFLLQSSLNILASPEEAATELLGLPQ